MPEVTIRTEKGWMRAERAGTFQTDSEGKTQESLSENMRKEKRNRISGSTYAWGLDGFREDGKD